MTNKIAIITGGTKGIGFAIVRKFLLHKFTVYTCGSGSSVDKLEEINHHPYFYISKVDLKDKIAIKNWANEIIKKYKDISVLINNAGRFLPGSIEEEAEDTFEELMATNLGSAYHTTRAFLPALKENSEGHIFNICSTASITAYVNGGSYCISKFGLLGLSKVLREELKPFGIKVTSIIPGATYTDSWASTDLPEERFMKADDIADMIWAAYSLSPCSVVEEILMRPLLGDIS